jgi:hypothetical protein
LPLSYGKRRSCRSARPGRIVTAIDPQVWTSQAQATAPATSTAAPKNLRRDDLGAAASMTVPLTLNHRDRFANGNAGLEAVYIVRSPKSIPVQIRPRRYQPGSPCLARIDAPSPDCSSTDRNAPRRTRTYNPLIKSQLISLSRGTHKGFICEELGRWFASPARCRFPDFITNSQGLPGHLCHISARDWTDITRRNSVPAGFVLATPSTLYGIEILCGHDGYRTPRA